MGDDDEEGGGDVDCEQGAEEPPPEHHLHHQPAHLTRAHVGMPGGAGYELGRHLMKYCVRSWGPRYASASGISSTNSPPLPSLWLVLGQSIFLFRVYFSFWSPQ